MLKARNHQIAISLPSLRNNLRSVPFSVSCLWPTTATRPNSDLGSCRSPETPFVSPMTHLLCLGRIYCVCIYCVWHRHLRYRHLRQRALYNALASRILGFPPWLVQVEAKFGNQISALFRSCCFPLGLPRWKRIWLPGTLLTQTKRPPRQARWRASNLE